ncbi:AMP-binding protein [Streptomyces sp. SGAir0957]
MRSFGASSAHKGMWRAQEMAPDTPNHALTMWDVDGDLDKGAIESAFLHVMDEAEVLRVTFRDDGEGLRLIPRELGDWRPFTLDLSAEADPEQAARDALADLVRRPFDLGQDLLFRLGVVTLSADRHLLVIAYHHLISDGFGAGGLLSRRLAEVYTALVRGEPVPGLEHPWDTASFAAEATDYLVSEKFSEDSAFWRDYLTDAPAPAQIPRPALSDERRAALAEPLSSADRWSEVAGTIGMVSRTLTVPRAEADTWTEAAQDLGLWMSQLVTAATAVYLRHRCERPEFLLSLAVGNRIGVASRTPGLAVNVVPVHAKVGLGTSFADVADALVDDTYEIFDHTACHYSDIQRAAATTLSDRGSYGAVVNVVEFVERIAFGDSPARYCGATTGTFEELSIGVYTDGSPDSDLFIRLDAPARLYDRAELRFIGEDLIAHIRAVLAAGDRPVGALDVLTGEPRERVLAAAHGVRTASCGLTLPELFTRTAGHSPDAVALADASGEVTYGELAARSDRLARALRARGIGPETVVAVALPRSAELAATLLGVAKAGGAYLPVDPAETADRITARLTAAPARLLLTDAATAARLGASTGRPVTTVAALLSDDQGDAPAVGGVDAPATTGDAPSSDQVSDAQATLAAPHPDQLLAVLPDAADGTVALTHRALEQFTRDQQWSGAGDSTVLWHTPHTSDALALELWVPLLAGGRVVVAPGEHLDADALAAARAAHGITTLWLPAGRLATLAAERPEALDGLREVVTGGDRVPAAALRRVRAACPGLSIVLGHGPAASAGFTASHRLTPGEPVRPGTLGRPLDATSLHVLGPGLAPVPAGVTGDLYVAGPGLARGFAGRAAATAEHFVACPFGPAGTVMYRTGDRVRLGDDDRLVHVGRAGAQVDVRGARVEPAEVEEALADHDNLARAVVVGAADEAGRPRLAAYVVPAAGRTVSADELRRFAASRLPEALVPSVFTVLDALPVTAGGRVDLAALPEPAGAEDTYRAPRNDTERILAKAFADVLELERVGIDDDFFDLGGNSLRAIRLVGLIRTELKQEVSIRRLFAARTVTGLSDMWKDLGQARRPSLRRRTRDGAVL